MARPPTADEIEDRLRVEFVDNARDRLHSMYKTLERARAGELPETETLAILLTEANNLRGCGTAFGFPAVSMVAMRMLEYFTGLTQLGERERDDAVIFLDRLSGLVDRSEQPQLAETNTIVRKLPVRYEFDVADVDVHDVEIMLVTPSKVVAKKVTTELAACGFRSITIHDPIDAIGLVVRLPPDMLIASMVMDHLSGLDLIRALRAMSVTQKIPLALLTSLEPGNPALRELPPGVGVIRSGAHFGEDFASLVTRFNLG